ncbi:M14 family metallopeptidase [Flavobacterium silvaticum]|uniref:DUF2817 domain-containing protein n=1 Tax=Flavobacterium silvaticum TaxID=1852020 RepID=A0A972FV33_9FLAO|nr:M14 metallopeptidase family protein [Flavobacterium silvaticum]NMH29078.1 DUF2817 domain-containing protein [Flavobacterium silvaticum]
MDFAAITDIYKADSLFGRYITLEDIEPLLLLDSRKGKVGTIGNSVEGRALYSYTIGHGPFKILMWSQMHGNESTATKALFDLFDFFDSDASAQSLLDAFTFCFVPMLNPDGALRYTRENANSIDLNRDFINFSQPESRALANLFESFRPDFSFNLHDQRSIFGVGETGEPATLSFLAPAYNAEREINDTRKKAIEVIIAMNQSLQEIIPGKVGRFDDSFNPNCVGDNFQMKGCPTVLIESGHYPDDYNREFCRKLTFQSILAGIFQLNEIVVVDNVIEEYLIIPQNMMVFFDFGFKNVKINYDGKELITNFVAQYKEELIENKLFFNAYFADSANCDVYFSHESYEAEGALFQSESGLYPAVGEKANFMLGNQRFENGKRI